MPSVDEWWSVLDQNGSEVSLHNYAWDITTYGGSRASVPPLRGADVTIAYRPGQLFRPKVAESRTISLSMYVQGSVPGVDPTASGGHSGDPTLAYNDNWQRLRNLFWRPSGAQFPLYRRVRHTVAGVSTILRQQAMVSLAGQMEPTMTGRARSTFSVDLLMSDPFFYGDPITVTIPRSPATGAVTYVNANNPGDDVAAYLGTFVVFAPSGSMANPNLVNRTPQPQVSVQLRETLTQAVSLDVYNYRVTNTSTGSAHTLGTIKHAGARPWFGLLPGDNSLYLRSDSGAGNVQLTFRPPYV